jgi:hypothetical protein
VAAPAARNPSPPPAAASSGGAGGAKMTPLPAAVLKVRAASARTATVGSFREVEPVAAAAPAYDDGDDDDDGSLHLSDTDED